MEGLWASRWSDRLLILGFTGRPLLMSPVIFFTSLAQTNIDNLDKAFALLRRSSVWDRNDDKVELWRAKLPGLNTANHSSVKISSITCPKYGSLSAYLILLLRSSENVKCFLPLTVEGRSVGLEGRKNHPGTHHFSVIILLVRQEQPFKWISPRGQLSSSLRSATRPYLFYYLSFMRPSLV